MNTDTLKQQLCLWISCRGYFCHVFYDGQSVPTHI